MKKISRIDLFIEYEYYKPWFISAYRNNGHNIELALSQVAINYDEDKERLRYILKSLIKKLNS